MTIFLFDPHKKEFFLSVKETETQRPPSLPKTILVATGTAQHLWLILLYHRGLCPGLSLRGEAQIHATLSIGLAVERRELFFEALYSKICVLSSLNLTTVFQGNRRLYSTY